ncbi:MULTISPECIES: cation:proton antiporter domain-containing protein [unclassified Streptomyces]|uniref:cation:proton antiporter domain-containing protein n=1 Tax=unclassified Streptomyces TaxID=2593676 RepID=UPI002E197122|nr:MULTISPECIES: cation:proton antiporter [unclassified Streptomyces]
MAQDSATILAETAAGVSVILVAGSLLVPMLKRLRQPPVIAEILAGIALGPSLLGLLPGDLPDLLFPPGTRAGLSAIAQIGILLFMFLIGWEIDLQQIKARRNAVLGISLSAIAVPFATGALLAVWLYGNHDRVGGAHVGQTPFVLFVGTAMAITAFPVLARIILEHRLQHTRVGILALASAAVGDALAWCMLAVVSVVAVAGGSGHVYTVVGGSVAYAVVLVAVVRPLLRRLVTAMTRNDVVSPRLLPVIAAGALGCAFFTHWIGLDAIFGAFTFGLIMPRSSLKLLTSSVRAPFEHVTTLLMPIFFITTGLSVDVTRLGGAGALELVAIILVACFGKVVGASGASVVAGMPWKEATAIGVLMNTRGLTELIILNAGVSMGVLDDRMFTMMVLMALVTTALAGPLVPRKSYARGEIELPLQEAVLPRTP